MELYPADSGSIRFKAKYRSQNSHLKLALSDKADPKKDIYEIYIQGQTRTVILVDFNKNNYHMTYRLAPIITDYPEFKLTWFNGVLCFWLVEEISRYIFKYTSTGRPFNNIGFVKFYLSATSNEDIDWIYEVPPTIPKPAKTISIQSGKLKWVRVTDECIPLDALIGGFEGEPLYIARAMHANSLCPGKYKKSAHKAFVPWGGAEHAKTEFEILCGYNAEWVKTLGDRIPENAFIAGYSEVRRQPLYIGRAKHDNHLLTGKVHVLYRTCYLPYERKEIEVGRYEILVIPNKVPRGIMPEI